MAIFEQDLRATVPVHRHRRNWRSRLVERYLAAIVDTGNNSGMAHLYYLQRLARRDWE